MGLLRVAKLLFTAPSLQSPLTSPFSLSGLGPNPLWKGSTTKFTKMRIFFFFKGSHYDSAKGTGKELWMLLRFLCQGCVSSQHCYYAGFSGWLGPVFLASAC